MRGETQRRSQRNPARKRYAEDPSSESDDEEVLSTMNGERSRPRSEHGLSKLELRKIRNRESAAASRKRKSDRITELEAQVAELMKENATLKTQLVCPGRGCNHLSSPSLSRRRSISPSASSASTGGAHPVVSCTNNQLPAAEIPAQDNPVDPVRKRPRTTTRFGSLRIPRPSATTTHPVADPAPTRIVTLTSKKDVTNITKLAPCDLSWPNLADAVTADVNADATTMDSASTISDAELEEACKYISDESSSGLSDAELEEACKMLMDPW